MAIEKETIKPIAEDIINKKPPVQKELIKTPVKKPVIEKTA